MDTNDFAQFNFEGFKNTGPVNCTSAWMKSYLQCLEWDLDVETYFQPQLHIGAEVGNYQYWVKIDLWVNRKESGTWLIHFQDECENDASIVHPSVHAECAGFCIKNKLIYVPQHMNPFPEPYASNLDLIWKFGWWKIHLNHLWLVNRFFIDEPAPNLGKLKNIFRKFGFDENWIYCMIFHRVILADIRIHPLSDTSPLLKGTAEIKTEHVSSGNRFHQRLIEPDENF